MLKFKGRGKAESHDEVRSRLGEDADAWINDAKTMAKTIVECGLLKPEEADHYMRHGAFDEYETVRDLANLYRKSKEMLDGTEGGSMERLQANAVDSMLKGAVETMKGEWDTRIVKRSGPVSTMD